MIRNIILSVLLCAAAAAELAAQSLGSFRERLGDPAAGAAVCVTEHGDASEALARAGRSHSRLRFRGYRVCIFFDNGQNARKGAEAARALFAETFPDTRVYMTYNAPYFTVTAGDCVTAEEAIILMGRVRGVFPKAFLKNEELSVADLVK